LAFRRSRRGSASGVAAIMVAIMVVATAVSGAVIYYSRSGSPLAAGTSPPSGNGLSGSLSNSDLTNLTSALGGLSGNLSDAALSNLTSDPGGLSNLALTNLTSLGGLSGGLSNSTLAGLASSLGGPVVVADSTLPAADFTAAGTSLAFTCAASPSGAYLALTNNGTSSASVTSVSIASSLGVTTFTPSGACDLASGSGATIYLVFQATSEVSPSAVPGGYYAGAVSLSDGSQVPFAGAWQ
jgi:hypothetical protein